MIGALTEKSAILSNPYRSVDDVGRGEAPVVVINGGSTYAFFNASRIPIYETIFSSINTATDYESALKKVREENMILFGESSSLKYHMQRLPCDLVQIGETSINSQGYGIAVPKNSALKDRINQALLELRENGELQKLDKKWYHDRSQCGLSGPKGGSNEDVTKWSPFHLINFQGVAIIFAIGCVLALLLFAIEAIVHCCKVVSSLFSY